MKHNHQNDKGLSVRVGLTVLVLLAAAGPWLPPTWLWGSNHAAWLPSWAVWSLPPAGLALIWFPAGRRARSWLADRPGSLLLDRRGFAFVLVPITGAAVFWLLRDPTNMLGDGQTLAVMMAGGNLYHGFDFMTFHLTALIYRLSGAGGEPAAIRAAAVLSCLSGAGYLAAAAWSARRLSRDPTGKTLLYALLVFSAGLQVFFGYVEVYAPLAVFLLLFLTSVVLYLEGRGGLRAVAAFWSAALFFHLNALFLAPLLLGVLLRPPPGETAPLARRVLTVVLPPLAALAAAALILAASGYDPARMRADFAHVGSGSGILVSLTGPEGFLTLRHLKDVLNLLLLLAPVPLILMLARRRPAAPGKDAGDADAFLRGGAAWIVFLMAVVHLKLGAVRDWDLFAPHATVLILAGWYAVAGGGIKCTLSPALAARVAATALLLTVPWFALNSHEARSLARLESVAADLAPYPRGLLHEQFAYHHQMAGNQSEVIRHYRKCGEVCPNHPRFHAIYGTYMLNQGNLKEAAAAYDRSVAADSAYVYGWKMAALARVLNGDYEAALGPARRLAALGGQDAEAAAAHGMAAEETGRADEAIAAYLRGAALDPSRLDLGERAAGLQLYQGDYRGAESSFRRLLAAEPGRVSAALGLADAIWQDHLARADTAAAGAARARLAEVSGLIERMIAVDRRQGRDVAKLEAWLAQVTAARNELQDGERP